MIQHENPTLVILMYLLSIQLFIEHTLSTLKENFECDDDYIKIVTLYSNKYSNYKDLLTQYGVIEQSINIHSFRCRLIYSKIFLEFSNIPIKNINDLYNTLINIEKKVVYFFEEFFNTSSYISLKDFISNIIIERKHIITEFESNIA